MVKLNRIIFVEYRIAPELRETYLSLVKRQLQSHTNAVLYEGTDQPNVFVEQWLNTSHEDYVRMKKLRLEEDSEWDEITACIPGGRGKLHIWEFEELNKHCE
ncbi:hypothetical protein M3650_09705 [Paenibacillus sp. MER TA 81-3]|uniref:hypothetical protein n=1 Tax=Paenibacillus sp. MER TA 81-3 TaxID=2939573 RepID=UPI00204011F4|nr:hypothetical protein [Paenibacillus sp. MER TA 81-3]MCM3338896.1 hypothetical protein [Paenibacillus sp. MER TA 81-3]